MTMATEVPTDGHILHAEAYPCDEETMSFHLLYSETSEAPRNYQGRQFQIAKGDAETFARQIFRIIAEPDTHTAWECIAADIQEGDHEEPPQ
jgi:hypothetical protein